MKLEWLTKTFDKVKTYSKDHSTELLLGAGIAGMISCAVMAATATPKAMMILEEKRVKEHKEDLTKAEMIQATWKCYIPCVTVGALSVTSLICAGRESNKRSTALAAAYKLSETALTDYKSKIKETIGEKKAQEVENAVNKERIERSSYVENDIIDTGYGQSLCFDSLTGRYFRCDVEHIRRGVINLNERLIDDMYISLNEFYGELGIPNVDVGELLGWRLEDGKIRIEYSSQLTKNQVPCLVIYSDLKPLYA